MDNSLEKIQLLIKEYKERRDKLTGEIDDLKLELQEIDSNLSAINKTLELLQQGKPVTQADISNKYANMTKKAAILDVLNSQPEKGWEGNEIAKLLKINGIKSKTKNLLGDVYNELYRLNRDGKIEIIKKRGKRKGTRYQAKKESIKKEDTKEGFGSIPITEGVRAIT